MTIKDLYNVYFGLVEIGTNYECFYIGEMKSIPYELLNRKIYTLRIKIAAPNTNLLYVPLEVILCDEE